MRIKKSRRVSNVGLYRKVASLSAAVAVVMQTGLSMTGGPVTRAANATWNGTVDSLWSNGSNWSATPVPGIADTATFNNAGAGRVVIDLGTGVSIKSLIFDTASAASYTIGAGTVGSQLMTLADTGSITLNSNVATSQLINANLTLGAATTTSTYTITNSTAPAANTTLTLAGTLSEFAATAAAKTLTLAGTGNIALTGNITANSVAFQNLILTTTNTATVTLSGTNTLSTLNLNSAGGVGIVDIGSGTLTLTGITNGGGSAIQSTTGGTINATGGGSIVLPGNTVTDGGNFGTANGTTLTINAKISGASTNAIEFFQTTSGTGKVVLANNTNDFAGPVVINSGILSVSTIGNQGSTTSALGKGTTINIGNGTSTGVTLQYTGIGETTNRIINLSATTGAAIIEQAGTGNLKFTTAFTATGAGSKILTLTGNSAGTGEIAAAIVNNSGTATTGITKTGTGTWTLSGANSFTGLTTVSAGTLKLATGGTLVSGNALTIAAAGTFDIGGVGLSLGTVTNAGVFTNTGASANVVLGNGTTGAGTWSGPMNLTLNAGATSSVLSGPISTNGTFTSSGTGVGTVTLSGNIANTVTSITQNSATSFLTISGTNNTATSFNGTYTITNGIVTFASAAAVGQTGSTTIISGATTGAAIFNFAGVNSFLAANAPVSGMNGVIAITSLAAAEDVNFSNATVGSVAGLNTAGIFGASGTVNYTGVFTPQTAGVYKLGGGGGTLTFNQAIPNGSVAIGGTGGGTVVLANTNTFAGGITVNNGVLGYSSEANVGGAASAIAFSGNSGVQITGTSVTSLDSHSPTFTGVTNFTLDIQTTGNVFTFGQPLALGTGGFTKLGAGTLVLSGANTGTGLTTISAGTLRLGNATALPSTSSIAMAGTGTLDLFGKDLSVTTISGGTTTSFITDTSSSPGTSTLTLSNQSTTIGSLITDGPTRKLALIIANNNGGTGVTTLTNANTFSGGLTLLNTANGTRLVLGGALTYVGSAGALVSGPLGTGPITIGQAATDKAGIYVSVAGVSILNDIVFNTALGTDRAGIRYDFTGGVLAGKITANLAPATFSTNTTGAVSITGQITGASGLTIDNSFGTLMTVTLNNTSGVNPNNYQGATNIAGTKGVLTLAAANQIPDGANAGNVINNGALNLGGFSETINGLSGTGTLDGVSGTPTLTVGGNDQSGVYSGILKNTAGTLKLVKIGQGVQVLSGANTNTGTIAVNGGTLQFGKPASLYNAVTTSWTPANITVASGATLTFNVGGAADFTNANLVTLLANLGTGTGGFASGSAVGIDTSNIAAGLTLSGPITNTNSGAGVLGLTKLGTNNLTLTGANTYTGPTIVAGGTLTLPGTASVTTPSITAQTGGTFLVPGAQTLAVPVTVNGGVSAATAGTLSQVDGAFNTITLPTLTIGGAAGNPGHLSLEFGTGSDKITTTGSTIIGAGGALVDLTLVGTFDGTDRTLLSASAIDTSSGGQFSIGATPNTNNFILGLMNDGTTLTLTQTTNTTPAPAVAYFKGNLSASWIQTAGGNASNNFTIDPAGTIAATQLPGLGSVVHFYATGATTGNLATTLNQNFTIDSLVSDATATTAASIAPGTPAGTLTLSPASSANGILMNAGAGALSISAPIVLGADQTWTNNTAAAGLTLTGGISGNKNLTLVGGTASFTVSDTTPYVGNTNIINGLGGGTVILASGTLNLRANGDGTAAAQTLTYNNPLVITGTSTINADYQAATGGNGKTLAFPSSSIGAVTINIAGASHGYLLGLGNVTLNAAAGGTTSVVPNAAIWATMNDVTGTATAGNTNTLVLGGAVTSPGSAVTGAITDGIGGGNVAVSKGPVSPWTFTGNTSNTYTGGTVLTQAAAGNNFRPLTLAKTGGAIAIPGDLTLGNLGTGYTNVNLGGSEQISDASVLKFNSSTNNWGYFKMLGFNETIAGLSDIGTSFSGVIENMEAEVVNTNSTLTLGGSGTYSYNGYMRNRASGTGTGVLLVTWNGSGKQTISGANITYTGTTAVNAGTFELNAVTAFASPINFDAGSTGTLQIASATQGIPGLSSTDLTNSNAFVQNAAGTNSVLTVTQAANATFGGILRNNPNQTVPSTFGLTKAGAGTLTLTNSLTLTGPVTISTGTLSLAGTLLPSAPVNVAAATYQVLNDGAGNNGTINALSNIQVTATGATLNVGNNGGASTGNTVAFGSLAAPTGATVNTINFTGTNSYNQSFTSLALNGSTGQATTLNPTTTLVTIAGNVTNPMSGFTTANFDTLGLDGTSGTTASPNQIQGNILDNAAGGFTPTLLGAYTKVLKTNTSVWRLNGAASTWTGTTIVQAGTLQSGVNNAIPVANQQGVNVTATGAAVTATYDFNGFNQTLNGATAIALGGSTATSKPQITGSGSTVVANGNVTFSSTNNPLGGLISVSNLDLGAGARTFSVGLSSSAGTVANPDLDVTSNISNGSILKTGAGVLRLTGSLNLTQIQDSAGTIAITAGTTLNSTPVLVNGGVFDLGGTTQNGTNFTFVSGSIVNGTLTTTGTTNFLKQGPGSLTLSSAYGTGNATLITVNQGLISATSSPATPSTLILNYGASGTAKFFDTGSTLTLGGAANALLGGGQLTQTGAAAATNNESFASTLISGGASNIVSTIGAGGTVNLGLGTLTRTVAGTVDFTLPATGTVTLANPGSTGTLLLSSTGTAFATVGGNDWAANNTVTPGSISSATTAGVGGASLYTAYAASGTLPAGGNVDVTGTGTLTATTATTTTINSLRISGAAPVLTLNGTNTITSGGVLFSSTITSATITGGTIVPGAGQELVFISNKPAVTIALSSVIANGAGGPTTMTYRGNPNGGTTGAIFDIKVNNTYTGPTYITNGRVGTQTTALTAPFGTGAGAIVYVDGTQDGQFFNSLNTTIANPFVIIGNGFNEAGIRRGAIRLDSSASANPTLSGSITLVGDASIGNNSAINTGYAVLSGNILTSNVQGATSFALTKILTGNLRLSGTSNQQTATNLAAGLLNVTNDGALGAAGAPLNVTGASTLQFQNGFTVSAARPVNLSAALTVDTLALTGNSTIAGVISGTGGLTKTNGGGTATTNATPLVLSGVNTFTGNVTSSAGWIIATNSSSLGLGTKSLTMSAGTAGNPQLHLDPSLGSTPGVGIDLPATLSYTISNTSAAAVNTGAITNDSGNNFVRGNISITSGGGGLSLTSVSGTLNVTGNISASTSGRAVNIRGNGNMVLSGVISDGSTPQMTLTRDLGTGTSLLSGTNTYGGATAIQNGTLQLGNNRALGAVGGTSFVNLAGSTVGTTVSSGATLDLAGTTGVTEAITLNGAGLGGNGALINSNTINAATITSAPGTIAYATVASGTTTASTASMNFTGGGGTGGTATANLGVTTATFAISGGTTVYSVAPTVAITGGGGTGATATANLTAGVVSSITLTAAGSAFTSAPTITFSAGTVTTAGTNPTGVGNASNFTINSITLTNAGSGYTSSPTFTNGTVTVTPVLAGVTLATSSSIGGAGDIQIDGSINGGSGATLTKVGAGRLTLTADNGYTGATAVTGGRLHIAGSLSASSAVSVGSSVASVFPTLSGGVGATNGGVIATDSGYGPFYNPSNTVGNVQGAVTIAGPGASGSAGHLAPGNLVGTIQVGSLALNAGSILDYEFNSTANDLTTVSTTGNGTTTGLVITAGAGINLYQEGSTAPFIPDATTTYHLIEYSGVLGGDPTTMVVQNPVFGVGYTFGTSTTPQGNFVDLTVSVPEPTTLAIAGLGAVGLLAVDAAAEPQSRP